MGMALKGTVDRYISQPKNDGFAVVAIKTPDGKSIRICGRGMGDLVSGQNVEVEGQWTTHPRWGKQFRANNIMAMVPEAGLGLRRWLVQVGIPGVGEVTASKLVAMFGSETISRIAGGDPMARELLGKRFEEAQKLMLERKAEEAFGPLLAEYDIGPELRRKIFEKYGLQTAKTIEENPYKLIADVEGIAFSTADRIAKATGVEQLSRTRLVAAAIDSLRSAANDGHTAVANDKLGEMIKSRTGVGGDLIEELLEDIDHRSVTATVIMDEHNVCHHGWALVHLDRCEEEIAERVLEKLDIPSLLTVKMAQQYVARAQFFLNVQLNEEQEQGAIMALSNSFCILTGGPGTGKTTTLRVITEAWRLAAADGWVPKEIKLGAPTGKASQRMKEATSIEAMTIHRLLEVDGENGGFKRDQFDPLEAGFIAVDEASMKDTMLAAAFARAWGTANVLFIGDPDQLASVGPGRVLGDMIDSGVIPVTHLVQVRRQAEGSAIAEGAKAIREGRIPEMHADSELIFIEAEDPDDVADYVSQFHAIFAAEKEDVQVLTPGHQGKAGTINLNSRLQEEAGHAGEGVRIASGMDAYVNDKVIQIENDNDASVFNGDAGRVTSISQKEAVINLGGREIRANAEALKKIALAYALSVHKSQGSEYGIVIMPITKQHWTLLRRTLVYTGLTRAKQMCIIIGSMKALQIAIDNDDVKSRVTTLRQRLIAGASSQ